LILIHRKIGHCHQEKTIIMKTELLLVFSCIALTTSFDWGGGDGGGADDGTINTFFPEVAEKKRCPNAWTEEGNFCFWFSRVTKDWDKSLFFCTERGGRLAQAGNMEVAKKIRTANGFQSKDYWIGERCKLMGPQASGYAIKSGQCDARMDYICETDLQPSCAEGWVLNHMTCIKFVNEPKSQAAASNACKAMQSELAAVSYIPERNRIINIRDKSENANKQYWIGSGLNGEGGCKMLTSDITDGNCATSAGYICERVNN